MNKINEVLHHQKYWVPLEIETTPSLSCVYPTAQRRGVLLQVPVKLERWVISVWPAYNLCLFNIVVGRLHTAGGISHVERLQWILGTCFLHHLLICRFGAEKCGTWGWHLWCREWFDAVCLHKQDWKFWNNCTSQHSVYKHGLGSQVDSAIPVWVMLGKLPNLAEPHFPFL